MACGSGKKGSSKGAFNSTTAVVLVDSPPAGKVRIIDLGDLQIYNRDTASVTATLSVNGLTWDAPTISTVVNWVNDAKLTLRSDETLKGVLGGAVATNQPNYFCSFEDYDAPK